MGSNGISMRLYGVEKYVNHLAYQRAIVMHGADYVSEQFISEHRRLGRSLGCPAVGTNVAFRIISTIANGSCMFAYYPQRKYLSHSVLLNSSLQAGVH
jgi:hypothetical protein